MFRTASKTERAQAQVSANAEKVNESAQAASARAAELKVKAAEAAESAKETAEVVKEKAAVAAETIAPKVEHARDTFVDDVLPKIAAALATIAAGAAAAKESAVETADRAPDAFAVLKGDAAVKQSGGRGKWILLLGSIAAGAAVMAWRKSNERPDPWATAGSYTPPKPASEKVSDLAGTAKEKVAELKDTATEKAGALKAKATDAKDTAAEKAAGAKDTAASTATEAKSTASTRTSKAGKTGAAGATTGASTSTGTGSGTSTGSGSSTDTGSSTDRYSPRTPAPPPGTTPASSPGTPPRRPPAPPRARTSPPPTSRAARPTSPDAPSSPTPAVPPGAAGVERQAVTTGKQRVVVAGHVLGVRAHLVHGPWEVERQTAHGCDATGERVEQRLVTAPVARDDGRGEGQQWVEDRRAVQDHIENQRAVRGDPLESDDQPRWEVERPLVEPGLEEQVGPRLERCHQPDDGDVGVLRPLHPLTVVAHRIGVNVLGVDPQAVRQGQDRCGTRAAGVGEHRDGPGLRGVPGIPEVRPTHRLLSHLLVDVGVVEESQAELDGEEASGRLVDPLLAHPPLRHEVEEDVDALLTAELVRAGIEDPLHAAGRVEVLDPPGAGGEHLVADAVVVNELPVGDDDAVEAQLRAQQARDDLPAVAEADLLDLLAVDLEADGHPVVRHDRGRAGPD